MLDKRAATISRLRAFHLASHCGAMRAIRPKRLRDTFMYVHEYDSLNHSYSIVDWSLTFVAV